MGSRYSTLDPNPDFCDEIMGDAAQLLLAGNYDLVVMSTLDRRRHHSRET